MHGFVDVPENPAEPKGPSVHIFYYGQRLDERTPIVFFNGGPTSDSHGSYRILTDQRYSVAAWATAPLIFIDQRGNGCSSKYPQGDSDEVLTRLKFYDSSAIVGDAEVVRKQILGDKPWKVFGQSYGAWIVHRYAALAPNSIVSAFAHSEVLTNDSISRLTDRIFAQNRVLKEYFKQYPDDQRRLEILHEQLTANVCYPNPAANPRRCGLANIDSLLSRFAFIPRWPWVHDWLKAIVVFNPTNGASEAPRAGQIDTKVINDFLKKVVFSKTADPQNDKYWATQIINHYDRDVTNFDRPTCEKIYFALSLRREAPETYLLHECMVAMQYTADKKRLQDRDERLARFDAKNGNNHLTFGDVGAGLGKLGKNAFFLYSGQLDIYVPVESFQTELQQLGRLLTYRAFTASGHDGFYSETQVAREVLGAPVLSAKKILKP